MGGHCASLPEEVDWVLKNCKAHKVPQEPRDQSSSILFCMPLKAARPDLLNDSVQLDIPNIHSSGEGHLNCFHFLRIVNVSTMTMAEQVSVK